MSLKRLGENDRRSQFDGGKPTTRVLDLLVHIVLKREATEDFKRLVEEH